MGTALTRTTADKQKARTLRHYTKTTQVYLSKVREFTGKPDLLVEDALDALHQESLTGGFRHNQSALGYITGLSTLLADQEWAAHPEALLVRADELQPGDVMVELVYQPDRDRKFGDKPSRFGIKARQGRTVVEVRPDRIEWDDGRTSWPKAHDTYTIERRNN